MECEGRWVSRKRMRHRRRATTTDADRLVCAILYSFCTHHSFKPIRLLYSRHAPFALSKPIRFRYSSRSVTHDNAVCVCVCVCVCDGRHNILEMATTMLAFELTKKLFYAFNNQPLLRQ